MKDGYDNDDRCDFSVETSSATRNVDLKFFKPGSAFIHTIKSQEEGLLLSNMIRQATLVVWPVKSGGIEFD